MILGAIFLSLMEWSGTQKAMHGFLATNAYMHSMRNRLAQHETLVTSATDNHGAQLHNFVQVGQEGRKGKGARWQKQACVAHPTIQLTFAKPIVLDSPSQLHVIKYPDVCEDL